MTGTIPDILSRIVETKKAALPALRAKRAELERQTAQRAASRKFREALMSTSPAIIAEVKHASPSKGAFTASFDPASIARTYVSGGAAALSVLTDEQYFRGSLNDLEAARAAVHVPVLRKDFTLEEVHVLEAAAHGADAILLIAALLDATRMGRLRELAHHCGMDALVEVHDEAELQAALASGAEIVGINNRNLHTFEVSLQTTLKLADEIPSGILRVSESGIHSREDVALLRDEAGVHAFLVGEHLMKSADPAAALKALRS
jgi:indole-3-glycerol phosphate synthase